jgi:MoaA/NifB/PqqE/SkfB family radical SAM enzyme
VKGNMIADIYTVANGVAGAAANLSAFYDGLVAPTYPGHFPKTFKLAPSDWHLAPKIVDRASIWHEGEYIRPLGTLDVEFLSDQIVDRAKSGNLSLSNHYPCGLKCPGCFSEDKTYDDGGHFLSWREMFAVIDDARRIGLASIKFLGPGELFQNPDLFDILDAAEERNLPISIFTKGAELGDDALASDLYGHHRIHTARELVNRVVQYSCVRVLLGFNSFDPVRQDAMVGSNSALGNYRLKDSVFTNRGVEKYTHKRNQALINLVAAGLNAPDKGQRLSLIAAPIRLHQIDEVAEMYVWAARRNMPLVIAPTMESGPKAVGLMQCDKKKDPCHLKLKDMYVAVYSRAIREGILKLNDLEQAGVSAYMGTAACNQVANGLYVRLNGVVQMCPGTIREPSIFGNVHTRSIIDIWKNSSSCAMGALHNNWCAAKQNGMPDWLQDDVLDELRSMKLYSQDTDPALVGELVS